MLDIHTEQPADSSEEKDTEFRWIPLSKKFFAVGDVVGALKFFRRKLKSAIRITKPRLVMAYGLLESK